MIQLEFTIIKKNIAKTRDILNYVEQNLNSLNRQGYIVSFNYANGKGSYPELKIDDSKFIGVSKIKQVLNNLISGNTKQSEIANASETFLDDQMKSLVGSPEDDNEVDEEALTNDRIRARTESINAARANRWDPSSIKTVEEPKKEKKSKKSQSSSLSGAANNAPVFGKGQVSVISDSMLDQMVASKLDL